MVTRIWDQAFASIDKYESRSSIVQTVSTEGDRDISMGSSKFQEIKGINTTRE